MNLRNTVEDHQPRMIRACGTSMWGGRLAAMWAGTPSLAPIR
jgi:hypothetical protein